MQVIWKYPIQVTDAQIIMMPKGAEILSANNQGGNLCIWAKVSQQAGVPLEARKIRIYGTGHPHDIISGRFINTVLIAFYVWHVFEEHPI